MGVGKTGGSLKSIFDPAKKAAAAAVMEPAAPVAASQPAEPRAKPSARNVRISGYIPLELDAALREEVVRRTVAERRSIKLNDVLCDALAFWQQHGKGEN